MKKAIYPGSFDPFTNGHLDILERSLPFFSEIIILVASSSRKTPLLSPAQRVSLIQQVLAKHLPPEAQSRVRVESWSGLLVDYLRSHQISAIVRGLRAASDFEYEFMMAGMNKRLYPGVETWFMMTAEHLFFVSSSMVKELLLHHGDFSAYVPPPVYEFLMHTYSPSP